MIRAFLLLLRWLGDVDCDRSAAVKPVGAHLRDEAREPGFALKMASLSMEMENYDRAAKWLLVAAGYTHEAVGVES